VTVRRADIHQHLWPDGLLSSLSRRTVAYYLSGEQPVPKTVMLATEGYDKRQAPNLDGGLCSCYVHRRLFLRVDSLRRRRPRSACPAGILGEKTPAIPCAIRASRAGCAARAVLCVFAPAREKSWSILPCPPPGPGIEKTRFHVKFVNFVHFARAPPGAIATATMASLHPRKPLVQRNFVK